MKELEEFCCRSILPVNTHRQPKILINLGNPHRPNNETVPRMRTKMCAKRAQALHDDQPPLCPT